MNSRNWVNFALFIFLVTAVVIYLNKKNTAIETQNLSSLKIDEITEIRIPREQDKDIVFNKAEDANWYMLKPYQVKAHQFRIKTLLGLTQTVIQKSYDTDSLNLSDYSLDHPRARIIFNTTEISFGKINPVNNKRYLLAENKLSLLDDQIYPLVSAQASSFIDLALLPGNFKITKIETPATIVELNPDNVWEAADKNKLNTDQIQAFLQHWTSAQAFAIHAYLSRKNLGKIKISSQSKTITFEITDDDPWLILASPELNIEYHLDKSQKNILYGILNTDSPSA